MSASPARDALRAATHEIHERLHELPAFAPVAAGTIGREAYVALLGRLYGFHEPVEAALAGSGLAVAGVDDPAWRRAPLLRRDLAWFGVDAAEIDRLPKAPAPDLADPATALGCRYVLEGSTLGGRQLARRLDGLLAPGDPAGREFFGGGAQPGQRWTALCRALERVGATEQARDEMVCGAIQTFLLFEMWFRSDRQPGAAGP